MLLIKIKIMPESIESNLAEIEKKVSEIISNYNQKILGKEIEPIAFGLKSLVITFSWPDDKGFDDVEKRLEGIDEVKSVNVLDVRRALG